MSVSQPQTSNGHERPARAIARIVDILDPRTRIVSAFAFVCMIAVLQTIPAKLAALAGISAFVLATSADLRLVARRLAHVEGFMIVLLLLLPFTAPGPEIANIAGFAVSSRGLVRAVSIILSVNAAVLTVLALLSTLEPVRLARALGSLGLPTGLTHLLFFLIRYLGIFREEFAQGIEAMRARGFRPGLSRHAMRSYGNLIGMLLVRSIERAERVDEAMRCRGFTGRFPMRGVRPLTPFDYRFMVIASIAIAALLIMDRLT
ncbi:MAG: cobalt ECF transporter T component CbiQ [Hyphomicrobiales bacterium]|nr:cobalt ECF transporter T component CbiQ [Hyphomicrobiales bacterium]